MEIKRAVTLVQLPRTLHEARPPKFGNVHSLAGQKRKRHEICAAIDGDSVNIYEVGDGCILSSYPVPPISTFLCSPCSIHIKSKKPSFIRRTYCAIERVDKHIECFTETSNGTGLPNIARTTSPAIEPSYDPIYLDTILDYEGSSNIKTKYRVLLVNQDGFYHTYSEDLTQSLGAGQLCDLRDPAPISISAVLHVNLPDARKSFLKHRRDLLATVNDDSSFLVAAYTTKTHDVPSHNSVKVGVWEIEATQKNFGLYLKPLMAHELPEADQWLDSGARKVRFGVRASTVSLICGKRVVTYDIAALVPQVVSIFLKDGEELSDAIHLTSSLIVSSTLKSVAICDTAYGTVQTSLDLEKAPRNRGAGAAGAVTTIEFLAYFPRLEKVLALRGKRLVAYKIDGIPSLASESKTLLIDSVGRGKVEKFVTPEKPYKTIEFEFGTVNPNANALLDSWRTKKALLKVLVKKRLVSEFEFVLASELKRYASTATMRRYGPGLQLPPSACGIPNDIITFLYSTIFFIGTRKPETSKKDQESGRDVEVVFTAPHIISWLSRCGLLRRHLLQRSAQYSHQDFEIPPGRLAEAFMQADASLSLLQRFLDKSTSLDILDIVSIIKSLLSKALTHATTQHHGAAKLLEGPEAMEIDAEPVLVSTKTFSDLNRPQDDHESVRVYNSLVIALELFAAFGKANVTSSLRTSFDQDNLLALIQVLRQQLFRGGHTKSLPEAYPSPPPSAKLTPEKDVSPAQESHLGLDATVKLLSYCIDTIGPLGLFSQGEQSDSIVYLIPELKAEVNLAMEALEEASYLQGILRETVRYADIFQKSSSHKKHRVERKGDVAAIQKPGSIITLYSEPTADQGELESRSGPLPLSLRPEEVISETKRRKGNGQVQQRSNREMLEMRHRAVGRYTLERLVL